MKQPPESVNFWGLCAGTQWSTIKLVQAAQDL